MIFSCVVWVWTLHIFVCNINLDIRHQIFVCYISSDRLHLIFVYNICSDHYTFSFVSLVRIKIISYSGAAYVWTLHVFDVTYVRTRYIIFLCATWIRTSHIFICNISSDIDTYFRM